MRKRPSVWVLANGGKQVDQRQNLEKAALFLLLMSARVPREWGNRKVPPPALHDKRIEIGIGLSDSDGAEANQFYLAMKADTVHFNNPRPGYVACHELTAEGTRWAEQLLAEVEDGRKTSLLDWLPRYAQTMTRDPEVVDGPTAIDTPRDGDTFRWRVKHREIEQSVYVEIAGSLVPEALDEPLRFAVESKGEAPLLDTLSGEKLPTRIKITSTGISIVYPD